MPDFVTPPWKSKIDLIKSVVIENSITSIGKAAFSGCIHLTQVTIPENVTSIGFGSFQFCSNLARLGIPSGVTYIGPYAFQSCSRLTRMVIPDGVTSIAQGLFQDCVSLNQVTIGAGVSSINSSAFSGCRNLESFDVSKRNPFLILVDGVLFNHNLTTLFVYPAGKSNTSYVVPDRVSSLADCAFKDCANLTQLTIPESVTSIGSSCFSGCFLLSKVNIPHVRAIGKRTFEGCSRLTEMIIPREVQSIGEYAFLDCTSLTQLNITGVRSIGKGAFRNCYRLIHLHLSDNLKTIESEAFYGCSSLTQIAIPSGVKSIEEKVFYGCSSLSQVELPSVNTVRDAAFGECRSLTSVNIPRAYTIESRAFYNCFSLKQVSISNMVDTICTSTFYNCSSLTEVSIPDSVTEIEANAFDSCSGLTQVTIGAGLERVGSFAFFGCRSLLLFHVKEDNQFFSSIDGVLFTKDNKTLVHYPAGKNNTSYTIPDCVTSIESGAFSFCSSLSSIDVSGGNLRFKSIDGVLYNYDGTSIYQYPAGKRNASYIIPDDVTLNVGGVFSGCTSLTQITVPWKDIFVYTFEGCTSLTQVNFPDDLVAIRLRAFYGCSSLVQMKIPDNVKQIEQYAFGGCTSLTEVTFPSFVVPSEFEFSDSTFVGCTSLTRATFGLGISEIPSSTFAGCSSLTEVNIPISVKSIGEDAFSGCTSLTQVIIPASVNTVYERAFEGCTSLSSVYFLGETAIDIPSNAFEKCSSLTKVFVTDSYVALSFFCRIPVSRFLNGGSCGDYLSWMIDESSSHLMITGSGAMVNYSTHLELPWYQYRKGIRKVSIESKVSYLVDDVFYECENLSSINVYDNEYYQSVDGVLFDASGFQLIKYPPAKESDVFILPNSVTSIREDAFEGCKFLSSIEVQRDSELFTSDSGILFTKDESELVRYPPKSQGIDYSIPASVSIIDSFAFEGCSSLSSIAISESVMLIGRKAFTGCTNLSRIVVDENNQQFKTIDNVIFSRDGRILSFYPTVSHGDAYTIPEFVEFIDSYAFYGHNELKSIIVPNNISSIGSYAFSRCESLSFVDSSDVPFPNRDQFRVVVIDEMAFEGCTHLSSIVIPQSITSIESGAFHGCSSLSSIIIPGSVNSIKTHAFLKCSGLSSVTILGDSVFIASDAFHGCSKMKWMNLLSKQCSINCSDCDSLNNVTVFSYFENFTFCKGIPIRVIKDDGKCGVDMCWVLEEETGTMRISGNGNMLNFESSSTTPWLSHSQEIEGLTIGDGVTSIGTFAFEGCNKLDSVEVPGSVNSIGVGAFCDCRSLTSVDFLGSIEEIGQWAFSGCSKLSLVNYFGSTYIPPNDAFKDCGNLTSIKVVEHYQNGFFCGIPANRSLVSGNCGESLRWVVDKSQRSLTISGTGPMSLEYNSSNAPWNSNNQCITVVMIEEYVESIRNDVFGSCTAINIPDSVELDSYWRVKFMDEGKNVIWIVKRGDSLLNCSDPYDDSKGNLVDYFTNYHVFDYSADFLNGSVQEFFNNSAVNNDVNLSLKLRVQTTKEFTIKFYVSKGTQLGGVGSPLAHYFSQYYVITDSADEHITYDKNSLVTSDVNLTIKALCHLFGNVTSCRNTTTCRWSDENALCTEEEDNDNDGGSNNGLAIALGVVGGTLVIAAIVAVIFVFLRLRRKKELDQLELESLDGNRPETIEVTIKDKKTKLRLATKIGKGSFATVWKAESVEDGSLYAVKVFENCMDEAAKDAKKEAAILRQLDNNFVVGVYDCYEGKETMAIVMDYFELGSLETVLKKETLATNVGVIMLYHISRAMDYLHGRSIIHRDLKPGNVLVCSLDPSSPNMCKISDFGEARGVESLEKSMTMTSGLGTPYYMAPEMMQNSHYSSAIDVYSFGIMAAEVMVGKLSFGDVVEFDSPYAFSMMVIQGLRPTLNDNCSQQMQNLIRKCWDGTPSNRPSFTEILGELNSIIYNN